MSKKELGQFYTTNAKFIIGDLIKNIKSKTIVDPFVGNWDLLNLFENSYNKIGYDIDPKNDDTIKKNSLIENIDYSGVAVVTNPPYLLNNKTKDQNNIKIFKDNPGLIDLYQISIDKIIGCREGILIVPINFWTSERASIIRQRFLSKYKVDNVKIFLEKVFNDTSVSVCSFYFEEGEVDKLASQKINFRFVKNDGSEDCKVINLDKSENYSINIKYQDDPNIVIDRVSKENEDGTTNIFISLIDSNTNSYGIKAEIKDVYISNKSKDRSFMTLKINKNIDENKFIEYFNKELNELRDEYHSLFLGNYRNGERKKMTIGDVFKFSKHIIIKYGLFR